MLRIIKILILLIAISFLSKQANAQKPAEPLVVYQLDTLWYFIDTDGKQMFPPQKLTSALGYSEGFFRVVKYLKGKDRWMFLNRKGEIAFVPDCDKVKNFNEGMALLMKYRTDAKDSYIYGFIDSNGKQVLPYIFDDAMEFSEGLAYVHKQDTFAFINKKGEVIINLPEGPGSKFINNFAPVVNTSKTQIGYIDRNGKLVIDYKFDDAGQFTEGLAYVGSLGKYGFIDTTGTVRIPFFFDYVYPFSEGRSVVGRLDSSNSIIWGMADVIGNRVVDFTLQDLRDLHEGLAAFKKNDKWGFMDRNGKTIIEARFDYAESFRNGIAWASIHKENKYGFINQKGEFVITIPKSEFIVDLRLNRLVE